jgi:hypothetical protein
MDATCAYDRAPPRTLQSPAHSDAHGPSHETKPPSHATSKTPLDNAHEKDWVHYPEHDPIFQLIPPGSRPLTDADGANRNWPYYDSERSEQSDDPSIDPPDEYSTYFAEAEQEEYRRYRLRGGSKRFRPSDIGDEEIYCNLIEVANCDSSKNQMRTWKSYVVS